MSGNFPTISGRFPKIGGRNPSEIVVLEFLFHFDVSSEKNFSICGEICFNKWKLSEMIIKSIEKARSNYFLAFFCPHPCLIAKSRISISSLLRRGVKVTSFLICDSVKRYTL